MPDVSLHIVLEEPVVPVRGVVRGEVVVDVYAPTRCTLLTLKCVWETTDGGVPTGKTESASRATLFTGGDWEVGTHRYPFSMDVGGAPSFQGEVLFVRHELQATADLPWTDDAHAARAFEAVLDPESPPPEEPVDRRIQARRRRAEEHIRQQLVMGGGCLMFVIVPALYFAWRGFMDFYEWGTVGVVGGTVAIGGVLALWSGYMKLRSTIAERRLGEVWLVAPDTMRGGDDLACVLRFRPRELAKLNGITAQLACVEQTVTGRYKGRDQTSTNRFYDEEVSVFLGGTLPPGQPFEAEFTVPVPAQATPSFHAGLNSLHWFMTVHIDVAGYPDYVQKHRIRCLPKMMPVDGPRMRIVPQPRKMQVTVQADQTCPFCRETLSGLGGRALMTCGGCRTVYHRECLDEFDSCATRGCRNTRERA